MLFDPVYMLILIVFTVIGFLVQFRLKNIFSTYSRIPLISRLSGREVAEKMLRDNGIYDVKVQSVPGRLSDHYNPKDKTVNLSPEVYQGASISAAAVAAHECGHAVQHAQSYSMLKLRTKLVPFVNFAASTLNYLYLGMLFLGFYAHFFNQALIIIIIAQALITLFALVTLPVEIDASRRALAWLNGTGLTYGEEQKKAETALRWAAMTYIVAALASVAQLLYFIMLFSGRRK